MSTQKRDHMVFVFLSDSLHLARCPRGPSVLLRVAGSCSFLHLRTPLYTCHVLLTLPSSLDTRCFRVLATVEEAAVGWGCRQLFEFV